MKMYIYIAFIVIPAIGLAEFFGLINLNPIDFLVILNMIGLVFIMQVLENILEELKKEKK